MAGESEKIKATMAELATAFPATFTLEPDHVRPLKSGIREELYAVAQISHRRILAALARYCRSPSYLKAMMEGAVRLDLTGQPAGTVTAREANAAKNQLAALAKRASKALNEAGKNKSAPAAGTKRLSLADLKKAAAVRKSTR